MSKKKRSESGRGEDVTVIATTMSKEPQVETFTCQDDEEGCYITEEAGEMFNLSCNPGRVTLAELRPKVRCRAHAEKIARRRGKALGEPGCGVYPLAHTLKTMRSRPATAPPENASLPKYVCKDDEGCAAEGVAEEMYNTPCDLTGADGDKLLAHVRCRRHAEKIALARGKSPCEPGSGVYRLSHTLRRIGLAPPRNERERWENDYRRWVEDGRRERERKEREAAVQQYADAYADASVFDELESGPRNPQPSYDAEGHHVCGIPAPCCRHDRPVHRYVVSMGEVIGICDVAARVFTETYRRRSETDDGERVRKLLSTADLEQAKSFAARWLGRSPDDADGDDRPSTHRRGRGRRS